ncbi:MAG: hypothetical protein WA433_09140 [Desulfobaccales bacterium]
MKRLAIMGFMTILAGFLVVGTLSAQPAGPGPGSGGGYCPWMGGGGPGPQRGQGGWYCPWMNQQGGAPVAKPGQPLSADQAKALVEQDIRANPNLKAGKVIEKDDAYEVDVVTKDGSLVDKIQVNKQTGWFRSVH